MAEDFDDWCENCSTNSANIVTDNDFKTFVLQALCEMRTLLAGLQPPEE